MTYPTYVDEYSKIVDVLDKYNRGCAQADSSIFRPFFHERATIFGSGPDNLVGGPISFLYESVDNLKNSGNTLAVVARVDIVGTIANARIDTNDLGGRFYTDFINLVKQGEDWIIVSKVFHSHPAD